MAHTDINSEDRLVQKTFAERLRDQLGWESVYAWNEETIGPANWKTDVYLTVIIASSFRATRSLPTVHKARMFATPLQISKSSRTTRHRGKIAGNELFHAKRGTKPAKRRRCLECQAD